MILLSVLALDLVSDKEAAEHIGAAIDEYRRWCATNVKRFPAFLDDLERAASEPALAGSLTLDFASDPSRADSLVLALRRHIATAEGPIPPRLDALVSFASLYSNFAVSRGSVAESCGHIGDSAAGLDTVELMTTKETAARLTEAGRKTSQRTVESWIHDGLIESSLIEGARRISRAALERFISKEE